MMEIKMRSSNSQNLGIGLLLLVALRSVHGQVPTVAPTLSMVPTITAYPTITAWPTSSIWPTSTVYPTTTSMPTVTQDRTFPPILVQPSSTMVDPTDSPTNAPNVSSTVAPTQIPTVAPTNATVATDAPSTRAPTTAAPTAAPTMSPVNATEPPVNVTETPTASPTGSSPPTIAPTARPTTAMPTTSQAPTQPPVPGTNAPTSSLKPTTSAAPTASPTAAPTQSKSPTMAPTSSSAPTDAPPVLTPVTATLFSNKLTFVNVGEVALDETSTWVNLTTAVFDNFYQDELRRRLQDSTGELIQNFATLITFDGQEPGTDGTNTITYTQLLTYDALEGAGTPQDYATFPFVDMTSNEAYAASLRANLANFVSLQSPVAVPVFATEAPSAAPTLSLAPSDIPSMTPSMMPNITTSEAPSATPTEEPITSEAPSAAPVTPEPTRMGVTVAATLNDIELVLPGAGQLEPSEIPEFVSYTTEWFSVYFLREQARSGRLLQEASDVRDMTSSIIFNSQTVREIDGSMVNTIIYDQRLDYIALSDEAEDPEAVTLLPYLDPTYMAEYSLALQRDFQNFGSLRIPIESPIIPDQNRAPPEDDDDGLSGGAIAGIAIAGAIVVLGGGYFAYSSMRGGDNNGYKDPNDDPPPQFNISADEDVSTIGDDPGMRKTQSDAEPSLLEGGYGDQSVATVDYDYSKAYGGGDTSVVSSAGGTMGDTTRQTSDAAANSAALAALGAESQFRSASEAGTKEDVLEIIAPAGKLGVVIDTPDDGAPVVHAVKDSSVIADQIQVGDKLVAVDDEDVRSMTAIKVSKLISKKSANPERKLTIIRTSLVDEP